MVGPRAAACLLFLSLLAWPSTASTLEQVSQGVVSYQFDGDTHHDAPDRCDHASSSWALPLGNSTDGLLAPPDDFADVFVVDVPAGLVGTRLDLRITEGPGSADLDLGAFAPLCDGDVFAPHNQPFPFPTPPSPLATEARTAIDVAAPAWRCGDAWIFVVTDLDGAPAPQELHAAWTDGSEGKVPLWLHNHDVAAYAVEGPAFDLTGAWINLPDDWAGAFLLAQEVCGAVDGGAVYGDPAALFNDRISFTPIRAGAHLVRVTLADPQVPDVPTSVPLTCHACFDEGEEAAQKVSYSIHADQSSH
jgi:hypothetical protein